MFKSPIFWALVFLGAVFAFALGANFNGGPRGKVIPPFELTDSDGIPVTETDLQNKVTLLYFGFTYCPDFCPTTLRKISDATKLLKKEGKDTNIQMWFISIDPARDTPEVLKDHVQDIDPQIRTMSGTPEQLAVIQKHFGVVAEKTNPALAENDHYLFNYTISTMLVNNEVR